MTTDDRRARTERWFLRRGVPLLIDDYNASELIWTRARPFLILVLLLETLIAFDNRYTGIAQGVVFVIAAVLLLGSLVAFNRLNRRRALDIPREVRAPELVFFVFAPALIALVVSQERVWTAGGTIVFNALLLAVTYFVVGFGFIPMTWWALGKLGEHLAVLVRLTARTLPVLLVLTVFMFINAEIWQVAVTAEQPAFAIVGVLLIGLGYSFIWITSATFIRRLHQPDSWAEAVAGAADSPLAGMPEPTEPLVTHEFSRGVRLNLRFLLLANVGIQVTLVGLLVAVAYGGIGLLFITPEVLALWVGDNEIEVLREWTIGSYELVLTREHVRVCALVGALAGLSVAVSALTDESYRETFTADLVDEIEQNLAVRALYETLPEEALSDDPPSDEPAQPAG